MTEARRLDAAPRGNRDKSPPKARILLVDDDERNLLALSEVLGGLAQLVTATSGREALRHLLKGDFAVILLDVFMPGMDGYETASLIREREQTAKIPIIFLSAVNKETEHLMRGYAMGAVDYVFKPVDALILKSKVSVFVDLYDMRAQVEMKSRNEQELKNANLQAELEKWHMERELQDSRNRQAAILDALPIALYEGELDRSGAMTRRFIGGDLSKLTGIEGECAQSFGEKWDERIHPEDLKAMKSNQVLSEQSDHSTEYRWEGPSGAIRYFLDQCVRVERDGDSRRWAGTLLDVTKQRQLEAQLVQAGKMDAIGQLTGGVAHDFNNLLASVLGGLHLLDRRVEFAPRDRLIVDQIRHAAEQGAELVRRMMAFARKQDLSPTSVDPDQLCRSVAGLVEPTLGGTVTVEWLCAHAGRNFFVDRSQLELALVNLILNARDAMPNGGNVQVRVDEIAAPDGPLQEPSLRIQVRDEGSGIPSSLIERITEPFFTTKEAGKGTGLGLSMVMGFVQQSGGQFNVESAAGKGTLVELVLPSTPQPPTEPSAQADPLDEQVLDERSILLVDDDDAVRTVLGEQLRDLGMRVDAVSSGDKAIAHLRKSDGNYDLLLTDFAMPGLNGIETIESARQERPNLRAVLMTGYADEDVIGEMKGMIDVLRKPINLFELKRAIMDCP